MAQIRRLPETTKVRFVEAKPEKRCLDLWPLWSKINDGCGSMTADTQESLTEISGETAITSLLSPI